MLFAMAVAVLLVCAAGAAVFVLFYRKSKKTRYIVFAIVSALLSLAALAYCVLTMILVMGAQH